MNRKADMNNVLNECIKNQYFLKKRKSKGRNNVYLTKKLIRKRMLLLKFFVCVRLQQ